MAVNEVNWIKHWFPVLLCMGLIFYASSVPAGNIPLLFCHQDVVFHLCAYLVLGFYFARAFKKTYLNIALLKVVLFTVLFGIIFGISDELHQAFVPSRSVSGFDVFTDGLGAFLGSLIQPLVKI